MEPPRVIAADLRTARDFVRSADRICDGCCLALFVVLALAWIFGG